MTESTGTVMVDKADFDRLEEKVDNLATALGKLILIDERQANQGLRITEINTIVVANYTELNTKFLALNERVNKWVNMILGAAGLVSFLFFLYQTFRSH
jgi:hypothetical protein